MSRHYLSVLAGSLMVAALFAALLPFQVGDVTAQVATAECMALSERPAPHASADAIALYERCLAVESANAELLHDLGIMYEEVGNTARAEARYREALAVDPRYADVHIRLGWLLLRQGDAAGARAAADQALALTLNSREAAALAHRCESAHGAGQ